MNLKTFFFLLVSLILLGSIASSKELVFDDNNIRISIDLVNGSGLWNESGGKLFPHTSTNNLRIPALVSCNTIDTDINGNFVCGTDATGLGEETFNLENITAYLGANGNASLLREFNITFLNSTTSFGGEVTGTYTGITLSDTALDDQYIRLGTFNLGNISNKTYVDAIIDIGSFNDSVRNYILATNTSMKAYVDALGNLDVTALHNNSDANFSAINVETINGTAINLFNQSISLDNYNQSISLINYQRRDVIFNLGNYSTEYGLTGYKKANLTIDYPNLDTDSTDDLDLDALDNNTIIRTGNLTTLDTLNNYIRFKDFNIQNVSNNTLVKGDNATLAVWNKSGNDIFNREFDGNVGIGTTSPDNALHVFTDVSEDGFTLEGSQSPAWRFKTSSGNVNARSYGITINAYSLGDLAIRQSDDNTDDPIPHQRTPIYISKDGDVALGDVSTWGGTSPTVFIEGGQGNVGIGTTSPAHKLHVIGNINATGSINATRIEANEILVNGAVVNRSIDLGDYLTSSPIVFNLGNISNKTYLSAINDLATIYSWINTNTTILWQNTTALDIATNTSMKAYVDSIGDTQASTADHANNISFYLGGSTVNASILRQDNITFVNDTSSPNDAGGDIDGSFAAGLTVEDDSHDHTSTTISGLADVDLGGGGDDDFGEFSCDGSGDGCTIDSGVIDADNLGADIVDGTELADEITLDADLHLIGKVNLSGLLNITGNLTVAGLKSCDTINTNSEGLFTCGTDADSGADPSAFNLGNLTGYLGGTIVNASLIKVGNLSSLNTLDNYIRFKDFNLANISNNTGSSVLHQYNITFVNASTSASGELSGSFSAGFTLSNTALDDQYVDVDESPTAADISGSFSAGLTIGASKVQDDEIDYSAVTIDDFTDDKGMILNNSAVVELGNVTVQSINVSNQNFTMGIFRFLQLNSTCGRIVTTTLSGGNSTICDNPA